jgi:hypothetical protein
MAADGVSNELGDRGVGTRLSRLAVVARSSTQLVHGR